jgi:hypothetical protein
MLTRAAGFVIAGTSPIPTEIKEDQNRTWQHREPLKGVVIFWMKPKKTACHWDVELWTFTFRLADIVSKWIDWANTTCTASWTAHFPSCSVSILHATFSASAG